MDNETKKVLLESVQMVNQQRYTYLWYHLRKALHDTCTFGFLREVNSKMDEQYYM